MSRHHILDTLGPIVADLLLPITRRVTPHRVHGYLRPPWFAVGPVWDGNDRLAGFSVSMGTRAVAIHRGPR